MGSGTEARAVDWAATGFAATAKPNKHPREMTTQTDRERLMNGPATQT